MNTLIRRARRLVLASTVIVSVAGGALLYAPDAAWAKSWRPWLTATSPLIDTNYFSFDGAPYTGITHYSWEHNQTGEADFGAGNAVPRCYSSGTTTYCPGGQGDWVPSAPALLTEWHNDFYLQVQLVGTLSLHVKNGEASDWADGGCFLSQVKARFTYADGSTSDAASPCRNTTNGAVNIAVNLTSDAARDVVKVRVTNFESEQTFNVGSSDSTGSASRLDVDPMDLTLEGQRVVQGSLTWSLGDAQAEAWRYGTLQTRPVLASVTMGYAAQRYTQCGSTTGQRSRLVVRWLDLRTDVVDKQFTSPAMTPGQTVSFTIANDAKTTASSTEASRTAVPFEVHARVEVSTDGQTWGQCGAEVWKKLGDA